MNTTVTLSFESAEDAAEFLRIRKALRDGFTWDADRAQLFELVRDSEIGDEKETSP